MPHLPTRQIACTGYKHTACIDCRQHSGLITPVNNLGRFQNLLCLGLCKIALGALTLCFLFACTPKSYDNSDAPVEATNETHHQLLVEHQTMSNPLVIKTFQGKLQGAWEPGDAKIRSFKGVPFARSPTGERRWRPPESPQSWSGLRNATRAGAACWQNIESNAFVWSRQAFPRSEDCLYLNIWSATTSDHQPVMVWFHGGAHTGGRAHEAIFDGTELAKRGVVVVTVNYRLGPFGFLAHPALAAESDHNSAGNYGLLDKIAALDWVRDNISQFGGNPDNVTIFGQSAGSQSVCSLMVSPLARGLFHKAIGQSAACVNPQSPSDANGFERGLQLTNTLGSGSDLSAMRAAAPEAVLEAANLSGWATQSRIVVDGWVLPQTPDQLFAESRQAKVPLLLGSLANEGHLLFPLNEDLTQDQLEADVAKLAGSQLGTDLIDLYRSQLNVSPGLAQREIRTDLFMAYGMRRWARYQARAAQPTYLYFLDHDTPAFRLYWPEQPDLKLTSGPRSVGAYHSGDLAYVFGNTRKVGMGWQDVDHALSSTMVEYWTNFAKYGDPNSAGLPRWALYDEANHSTMLLGSEPQTVAGIRRAKLDLWDVRFTGQ